MVVLLFTLMEKTASCINQHVSALVVVVELNSENSEILRRQKPFNLDKAYFIDIFGDNLTV